MMMKIMLLLKEVRQRMTRKNNELTEFTSIYSLSLLPDLCLKPLQLFLFCMVIVLPQRSLTVYAADVSAPSVQYCEINGGPCSRKIGRVSVTLDIDPKPVKAMNELFFTVTLNGIGEYENLKLKLQMPGMFMGNNEVKLVKAGNGKYTGKGVLPKCHSDKRLWSATIIGVPGLAPPESSFLFNVLY